MVKLVLRISNPFGSPYPFFPGLADSFTQISLALTIPGGVGSKGTPKAKFIALGFFYSTFANSIENPLTGLGPTKSFIEIVVYFLVEKQL